LRALETVIFELCSGWFGCELGPAVQSETERLNPDIKSWIEHYGLAPVKALFQPNKDELWLQLSLVKSLRDKVRIVRRRVVPLRPPQRIDEGTLTHTAATPAQTIRHLRFLGNRAVHHARALAPLVRGGARWWWLRTGLTGEFLRFQAVSAVYCFGMSVFFLLYNLHLLKQGLREDVLGRVSGLMTLGTLAGTLPAAAITRRVGLRNTLLIAIVGGSAAALLRVIGAGQIWLLATAALHGLFLSIWAVSNSPVVSGLSVESNRRTAFSISCFAGIGIGIVGGVIGGRLPQALSRYIPGGADPTQSALIIAALVTAFAAWPAMRLRFAAAPRQSARVFPRQRFLWGFLCSILLWSFAVGAFNPFYNAFLSQHWRMNIPQIGVVQAIAQSLQLTAILASPLVLRRLGDVKGISVLLLIAGGAMAALAGSPNAATAAVAYIGFMSLQYMCEPGMFHLLMSRVPEGERSGASALYFIAVSIAGSCAAFLGGAAITRFGYSAMLAGCSVLAAGSALLFRGLVHERAAASMKSPTSS
jgi:MFS family permease